MQTKAKLVAAVLLLGAFVCFWRGLSPGEPIARAVVTTTPVTHSPRAVVEQAIETIRVGQRVWVGDNPSAERDYRIGEDIADPRLWREMRLRCPKRDGTLADVRMLRPTSWLEERGVQPGGRVDIEVPECGISGLADVLEVLPCPEITPGQGRVVTATFHHQAAQTIDVAVEGLDGPIGSTPNHPFWSETQGEFVRADQLRAGDEVRTLPGTARVTGVTPRGPPEPVYNLEVQCEHVYRVANAGLLVHNQCPNGVVDEVSLGNGKSINLNAEKVSTGRNTPNNLKEQLAMAEVTSNPGGIQLRIEMNDAKNNLLASDGWVKKAQNVNGVEIHYAENLRTGQQVDFKFKD